MSRLIVTLDAGNTLFTERVGRDAIYRAVLAERGRDVGLDVLAALRERLHDEVPDPIDGQPRYSDRWFREFVQRLLDAIGLRADAEEVRAELAARFTSPASFVVFADAVPALDDLTERGVRLALVSNWSSRLRELLEGLGLVRYFEVLVISAEVGHAKPAPGIFAHALRLLDARPHQVLHVGDHPVNDLAGARRAGWRALLLDRAGTGAPGPHVVRSLDEVAARLEHGVPG